MSAAQFGANTLAEVHEESLSSLLSDLRYSISDSHISELGVPELDGLLEAFRPSHQTPSTEQVHGAHTSSDHDDDDGVDIDIGEDGPYRTPHRRRPAIKAQQDLIEITSRGSSAGATSLLYYLTAISILPLSCNGKESTVVWLDTDARFSATRLYQICLHRLTSSKSRQTLASQQATAREALKHVHVFSIQSTKHLVYILDNLPAYLLQQHQYQGKQTQDYTSVPILQHSSSNRPLSLIILDSATAFHWPDRFATELSRLEARNIISTTITSMSTSTNQTRKQDAKRVVAPPTATSIITQLKTLQAKFDAKVLYTTTDYTTLSLPASTFQTNNAPQSHPTTSHAYQAINPSIQPPHLPPPQVIASPWSTPSTLSLNLTPLKPPQHPPYTPPTTLLQTQHKQQRNEIVRQNRCRVSLNEPWFRDVVCKTRKREEIVRVKMMLKVLEDSHCEGFVMRAFSGKDGGVEIER